MESVIVSPQHNFWESLFNNGDDHTYMQNVSLHLIITTCVLYNALMSCVWYDLVYQTETGITDTFTSKQSFGRALIKLSYLVPKYTNDCMKTYLSSWVLPPPPLPTWMGPFCLPHWDTTVYPVRDTRTRRYCSVLKFCFEKLPVTLSVTLPRIFACLVHCFIFYL